MKTRSIYISLLNYTPGVPIKVTSGCNFSLNELYI